MHDLRHIGPTVLPYRPDTVGLLLIYRSRNPVYINSTARLVISYAVGKNQLSDTDIREALREALVDAHEDSSLLTLISGRRKYACRNFVIEPHEATAQKAYEAIILERISRRQEQLRRIVQQYGLTPRERDVASLLMNGLTSKEIAQQLDLSAHTVKGYLHFIMTKLGVTTRSGIVGKLGRSSASDNSHNGKG